VKNYFLQDDILRTACAPMTQVQCTLYITKATGPQFPPNWGCWVAGDDIKSQGQYENRAQKKKIEKGGTKLLFWANLVLSGVSSQFWILPFTCTFIAPHIQHFCQVLSEERIMQIYLYTFHFH